MLPIKLLPRNHGESARSWVYKVILEAIVHLDLEPTVMMGMEELQAVLKLSRTPIREALIQLASEGFITLVPQRGSFVAPINLSEVSKARFIRFCLEKEILTLACDRCDQATFRSLRYLLDCQNDAIAANDDRLLYELDEKFHAAYYGVCNHENIWAYLRSNNLHFYRYRVLNMKLRDMRDFTYQNHEELYDALQKRDKKAAIAAIETHLDLSKWGVGLLQEQNPHWFVPCVAGSEGFDD